MSVKHYQRKRKWKLREFNKHRPIAEYLIPLIGDKKEVSILEVGAGPVLTLGDELPGVDLRITACDKLAKEYADIYGEVLFPIEFQDMENLTYPDKSFDIVHCVNALDHTHHPDKALKELVRVAKHFVYLRHNENEGETQKYSGLHRWNIELFGDDCRFWNKKREFRLSDFGHWNNQKKRESFTSYHDHGEQIISIYRISYD